MVLSVVFRASAPLPDAARPMPAATAMAMASGVAVTLVSDSAATLTLPPLASTTELSIPARVTLLLVFRARAAATATLPAMKPPLSAMAAASASAVTLRWSVAERFTAPPETMLWPSPASPLETSASTVEPTTFSVTAAATAPAMPTKAPDTATDTPTPVPSTRVVAPAVTFRVPAENTLESSMRDRTVLWTSLSATPAARERLMLRPAAPPAATLTAVTLVSMRESSLAVSVTAPAGALTSLSATMYASVVLVTLVVAMAPAPESWLLAPAAPPRLAATPTELVMTSASDSAVTFTLPVSDSTSEPEMPAATWVPKLLSPIETATARPIAAPPAAETLSDAATISESIDDVSVAETATSFGAVTSLPEITASTVLVVVLVTTAPLPAPESENPPATLMAADAATPVASMMLSPRALTVTDPPEVTSEPSFRAEVVPPMLFSARVMATARLTAAPPATAPPTATENTSASISEVSTAVTSTDPSASTVLPSLMAASTTLVVVLVTTAPAPAPASENPPLPAIDTETA